MNLASKVKTTKWFQSLSKLKQKKDSKNLSDFLFKPSPEKTEFLINHPLSRKMVIEVAEKMIYRHFMEEKEFPRQMQIDKYHMAKAVIAAVDKAFDRAQTHPLYKDALIHSFLPPFLESIKKSSQRGKAFVKRYGFSPPGFLVISPGRFCNLQCIGCYANSSSATKEKLSYETLDKILVEKTDLWGSCICVISGGEPLLWEDEGKTIIDLAKKHQDNFFLMYTNGTMIDKEMAQKLAEVCNITPAISVEGFEKETDARRGKGIFKKILRAMDNLKEVGVSFGISVTPTRKNAMLLTSEEFLKYFWAKGASYAWLFQLMPIGRASLDLVVTPEQRLKMFCRMRDLVKKGYFIADLWNSGLISNGCVSAGRPGGYLHIEWNGNITPCVFNPYSVANINEIYKSGKKMTDILNEPFLKRIREWQDDYALKQKPEEMGNLILPCPIRDHYKEMRSFIDEYQPQPIDEAAKKALQDKEYKEKMIKYGKDLAKALDQIWEKEYKKS